MPIVQHCSLTYTVLYSINIRRTTVRQTLCRRHSPRRRSRRLMRAPGSSIVRGLRKGLPIQQVAKLHNTSVKMIERHYAKYIATALEDLARAAVVSLVPRSHGKAVPMGKRA